MMPLTTTRLHVLTGSYSMNSRQQLTFKDSAVLSDSDISMRFLLGEMTDVKTVSPAIETGIINVSGIGFNGTFGLGESFTESGQVLTVEIVDLKVNTSAGEAGSFDSKSSGLKSTFRLGKSLSMKRRVTSRPRTRVMMSNVLPRFSSTRDTPRFTVGPFVTSCGRIDVSNGKACEEIEELTSDAIDHDIFLPDDGLPRRVVESNTPFLVSAR